MAAALEDVEKTIQIGLPVGKRVHEGVAHAGLGRQVADAPRLVRLEQFAQSIRVAKVGLDPAVAFARLQQGVPVPLELDRVVVVEIVQPDDLVPVVQQRRGNMVPDESGCPGDQYLHVMLLYAFTTFSPPEQIPRVSTHRSTMRAMAS